MAMSISLDEGNQGAALISDEDIYGVFVVKEEYDLFPWSHVWTLTREKGAKDWVMIDLRRFSM